MKSSKIKIKQKIILRTINKIVTFGHQNYILVVYYFNCTWNIFIDYQNFHELNKIYTQNESYCKIIILTTNNSLLKSYKIITIYQQKNKVDASCQISLFLAADSTWCISKAVCTYFLTLPNISVQNMYFYWMKHLILYPPNLLSRWPFHTKHWHATT